MIAQGIAAPTGGETRSGSTEGKSPTPQGMRPTATPYPQGTTDE